MPPRRSERLITAFWPAGDGHRISSANAARLSRDGRDNHLLRVLLPFRVFWLNK